MCETWKFSRKSFFFYFRMRNSRQFDLWSLCLCRPFTVSEKKHFKYLVICPNWTIKLFTMCLFFGFLFWFLKKNMEKKLVIISGFLVLLESKIKKPVLNQCTDFNGTYLALIWTPTVVCLSRGHLTAPAWWIILPKKKTNKRGYFFHFSAGFSAKTH